MASRTASATPGCGFPTMPHWSGWTTGGRWPPRAGRLLTTVDLQLEQIGRVAAQELLARIAGGTATGARLLPGRLIVRASSGRSAR